MLMARHKRNPPNELALNRIKGIKYKRDNKSVHDIAIVVCGFFGVSLHYIQTKTRKREVVEPRQVISYLARCKRGIKLREIGEYFEQPHDLIIHSTKAVINLIDNDKNYAKKITHIENML